MIVLQFHLKDGCCLIGISLGQEIKKKKKIHFCIFPSHGETNLQISFGFKKSQLKNFLD